MTFVNGFGRSVRKVGMTINRHYIEFVSHSCEFDSTIEIRTPSFNRDLKVENCKEVYEQLKKFMHNSSN